MKRAEKLVSYAADSIGLTHGLVAGRMELKALLEQYALYCRQEDLSRYEHGQQIIRLVGLNLKENSSGKHKGKSTITKRGRSRLRALLFRCVLPLVAKNQEFKALHHYFTTRSENPLKKKQSMIALCGKLIRVLHTLGTRQISYNANDVLGPIRQAQLQMAA